MVLINSVSQFEGFFILQLLLSAAVVPRLSFVASLEFAGGDDAVGGLRACSVLENMTAVVSDVLFSMRRFRRRWLSLLRRVR